MLPTDRLLITRCILFTELLNYEQIGLLELMRFGVFSVNYGMVSFFHNTTEGCCSRFIISSMLVGWSHRVKVTTMTVSLIYIFINNLTVVPPSYVQEKMVPSPVHTGWDCQGLGVRDLWLCFPPTTEFSPSPTLREVIATSFYFYSH
jgi:hypothetical protein